MEKDQLTKQQFVDAMVENGYQTAIVDNVPMIFVNRDEYCQRFCLDMEQMIQDMGYCGSYGFKVMEGLD